MTRTALAIGLTILTSACAASAQDRSAPKEQPSESAKEAPEPEERDWFALVPLLMESTFKIQSGQTVGTVFLLAHRMQSSDPGPHGATLARFVLVTAEHVLEDLDGESAVLHLRRRVGTSFERYKHPVRIREGKTPLWVSPPESDVAVLNPKIPQDAHIRSIKVLGTSLLANDEILEKLEVQPGDELMVLGYPFAAEGNDAGFPILRSGRIASYPLLPTAQTRTFLLDFEVFKGNSGGPVFMFDRNRHYGGSTHLGRVRAIVGVVSQEARHKEVVRTYDSTEMRLHRMSLAVVVHASEIRRAIEQLFPDDPIPAPQWDD